MAKRFMNFCSDYSKHFVVKGRDIGAHAKSYLSGLLGNQQRKNIGRIGEDVCESNYQGMQQLISDSPWDDGAVMEQICREVNGLLGGHRNTGLYLDETSFVKKGSASVGVKRQYCGRLGKLENCQVGVFACLGRDDRTALVDYRLFLPEDWANDEGRCEKAKIPAEHRIHLTKAELALEMVKRTRERGVEFAWIGGDEVYGNNKALTNALDDLGEVFLMDVGCNMHLYLEDPCPMPKPETVGRGRPAKGFVAGNSEAKAQRIDEIVAQFFETECRGTDIRETAKGKLSARIWVRRVWQWDGNSEAARPRLLVVRLGDDGLFKYSLSNAPANTRWERLAYMQAQRFWIERAFQDAKSHLGMAQYEVRGWRGWHHHMTLVCLALLFITKERLLAHEHTPLLSARDITEMLAFYLPRRDRSEEEIFRVMRARHELRARDLDAARRGQHKRKLVTK